MDYEFIYVVAFLLVVKVAAFSSEYSANNETKGAEQNSGRVELLRLASLRAEEQLTEEEKNRNWKREEEKLSRMKEVTRHYKAIEDIDMCDRILALKENPVKWREIKKTLHWLKRIIASNKSSLRRCYNKKTPTKRHNFYIIDENSGFSTSKRNSGKRKPKHFQSKNNKNLNYLTVNWASDLINSPKLNIYTWKNKKFGKERKYKHKSRRNRFNNKGNKDKKFKFEENEKLPYSQEYFPSIDSLRNSKFSNRKLVEPQKQPLKPSSDLFGGLKNQIMSQINNRTKNYKGSECQRRGSDFENSITQTSNNCFQKLGYSESINMLNTATEKSSESRSKAAEHITNYKYNKTEQKKPKEKAWPHFIYHRVSSNIVQPESKNHRRSAYVAISVASSSDPVTVDKKNN